MKKFLVIITIILLLFVFTGCKEEPVIENEYNLTDLDGLAIDKQKEIIDTMANYYQKPTDKYTIKKFYGVFDDCYVIGFLGGGLFIDGLPKINIAGEELIVLSGINLYIYRYGYLYDLNTAYEYNIIDFQQVKEIFSKIKEIGYSTPQANSAIPLDAELQLKIRRLITIKGDGYLDFTYLYNYYGTYNGAHVVFSDLPIDEKTEMTITKIEDIEFSHYNNQEIFVYKDEQIYTLEEAYELKILNKEELIKIKESYDEQNI